MEPNRKYLDTQLYPRAPSSRKALTKSPSTVVTIIRFTIQYFR